MLLYFPDFDINTHMNKDVVQFPKALARHMQEDLTIAAHQNQSAPDGVKVVRVSGFAGVLRHLARSQDKTVVLYFLGSKTKIRCILLRLLFPRTNIVIKADQNEFTFRVEKHDVAHKGLGRFRTRSLINRLFYKSVSQICVETRSVHDRLSSCAETRAKVMCLPNGSAAVPPLGDKQDLIVFVGRYESEQKNFGLFLEAVRSSQTELNGWHIDVIGESPKPSDTDLITYVGQLPHGQTMQRLADAKILALSSLHEGSPIVFAEAKAAGCAILTTDVSSARDNVASLSDGEVSEIDVSDYIAKLRSLVARCNRGDIDFQDIQRRYLDTMDWDKTTAALAARLSAAPH